MIKSCKVTGVCLVMLIFILGCGQSQSGNNKKLTAYEMMENAFVGNPSQSKIQPLMESVLEKYGKSINEDNLERAASVLVSLRKESKVGVTEMDVFKKNESVRRLK